MIVVSNCKPKHSNNTQLYHSAAKPNTLHGVRPTPTHPNLHPHPPLSYYVYIITQKFFLYYYYSTFLLYFASKVNKQSFLLLNVTCLQHLWRIFTQQIKFKINSQIVNNFSNFSPQDIKQFLEKHLKNALEEARSPEGWLETTALWYCRRNKSNQF